MQKEYNKSPLQWAGGKSKVLPILLPILEKHKARIFVEPFIGAANVSLNFDAASYVWCDTNWDLLCHHRVAMCFTDQFISECEKLFMEGFSIYNKVKQQFNTMEVNSQEGEIKRAAMFQYLNKHGFNGLCRYNSKGEFNTPIGTVTKPKSVPYKQIKTMQERFKSIWLGCRPFDATFKSVDKEDAGDCLIYCDPPYLPLTSTFKYDKNGFNMESQIQLAAWAKSSKHTTIISNHWTPEAEKLYADATDIIVFDVQRTISCKGSERKRVQECIVVYEK